MRIALISPPWLSVPPASYGGTERTIDTLARALVDIGHDVLLLATGDSTCPVPRRTTRPRAAGIEQTSPAMELGNVIAGYDHAREAGVDIVHDHSLAGPFFARRFPWLPVVTTNHGQFDGDLTIVYRSMAELVPVVAISHNQAAQGRRLGIPIEAVVHHGVDPGDYPIGAGLAGYAAFVGRMHPTKGVGVACQVARAAGIPLRIAAKMREPGEYQYFQACIRPLLGDGIEYLGELSRRDTLVLLGDALCLLNPIDWAEPFGLAMLESLAVGTPVVGTPRGAAPEIVDDGVTGFLRTAPHALVDALRSVEGLDRRVCRAVVEQRFTGTQMAQRYVKVFDDAVTRWPESQPTRPMVPRGRRTLRASTNRYTPTRTYGVKPCPDPSSPGAVGTSGPTRR
jgi:glycosyltransferase involved in cell wall biosynthesis